MTGRDDEPLVADPSREALRRAVYRRGADGADVARFLRMDHEDEVALGDDPVEDRPASEASPARRSGARAIAAAAGAVVAVAVLAGVCVLLLGGTGAFSSRPTPSPTARAASKPPVVLARDSGPVEFATGRATSPSPGEYRYEVVSGDTPLGIASRFHVCISDIVAGEPLAMQGDYLEPGAVLRLRLNQLSVRSDGRVHCVD